MIATVRPRHVDGAGLKARGVPAIASSRVQISMPTPQSNPLDPSNAYIRRVPKLAVRSRSDETAISDVSQSSEDSNNESQRLRVRTAFTPNNPSSLRSPSNLNSHDDHSRNGSSGSQGRERPHRHQPSKKKSSGVLGFLTLKEPSTTALEEFAVHEKRKAAQKGAKSIAMVIPGVSSQKLPDHVPKVNSKWDGLPEAAKRKLAEKKEKDPASPLDMKHFSLSRSGSSANRPYGSLSSKPSIRRSQDKKRLAVEVKEVGEESIRSQPIPTMVHPALRRSQVMSNPSSPPSDLELPDLSGYTITSAEASPRTPAVDAIMPMPMPMPNGTYSTVKPTAAVAPWMNMSDSDDVTAKNAGPNVLALPNIRTPGSASNYQPVAAPTINPASPSRSPRTLNIPTFSYSATPSSPASSDRLMPLPSPSSGSSASSGMFAQWKAPPKERLSMGPQIKKEQVLPWEMFDGPPEESETPRLASVATDSSKLKRFSYKLGLK